MKTYAINGCNDHNCQHQGTSPEQAADRHSRYCVSRTATARRATGTAGLSGLFQSYLWLRAERCESSYRQPFHVALSRGS